MKSRDWSKFRKNFAWKTRHLYPLSRNRYWNVYIQIICLLHSGKEVHPLYNISHYVYRFLNYNAAASWFFPSFINPLLQTIWTSVSLMEPLPLQIETVLCSKQFIQSKMNHLIWSTYIAGVDNNSVSPKHLLWCLKVWLFIQPAVDWTLCLSKGL